MPEPAVDTSKAEFLQKDLLLLLDQLPADAHITTNPIFGDLDFAANVQLLHKHALHHLRQFGLVDQ